MTDLTFEQLMGLEAVEDARLMPSTQILVSDSLKVLRPPPRASLSVWAQENIRLPAGVSATPGKLALWPTQTGIADAFGDPAIERCTLVKSVRTGLSTLITATVGAYVSNDPSPIMLLLPTDSDCRDVVVSDLDPIFSASPVLAGCMSDDTAEGERNTMTSRRFPGGSLKIVSARSPRNLRRHNVRILLIDEADAMLPGPEGSPVKLAEKRTLSFSNRKIIVGSTPTDEATSNVWRSYLESDQRVYEVPCPECGDFHEIRWKDIHWNEERDVWWGCPSCGAVVDENRKPAMVRAGRWRITKPETVNHAGFRLSALTSLLPNASWSALVDEFLAAKDDPALLQVFVNTILGEVWRQDEKQIDATALQSRAEHLDPDDMTITCGVDVQHDRLEAVLTGFRKNGDWCVLDQFVAWGDIVREDTPWEELDSYINQNFRGKNGSLIRISATAIDAGDGQTMDRVLSWCRGKLSRKIYPIKGASGVRPAISTPNMKSKSRLWIVGVDGVKSQIMGRLSAGSGIRFSDTLEARFYDELTSERHVLRYHRGQPVREWVRTPGKRAESLDCVVYAVAVRNLVRATVQESETSQPVTPPPRVVQSSWASLAPR
ncbi:phage terminase large subunit family protein [Acetobacter sicerae]|uniref:Phage terminase large subunit family protein n=1 Tax=Acetobacter sicerae TaxID=85325 RepID=A0ABS8VQD6_9PROT|nr:terminase gpA endonuclease subunit [Acetobacter sicerae]MCE0742907.1 phage terminase large subunit family protein [Acetobacter sicerae]